MHSKIAFPALRAFSRYTTARASCTLRAVRYHKTIPRGQPLSISFRRFNTTSTNPELCASSSSSKCQSSSTTPRITSKPLTDRTSSPNYQPRPGQPEYQITFTCTPCGTRSSHRVSKQGYHKGSTLITCPECRNRHIISDHLNIFGDRSLTIEDLMKERGMLVKKGTLSEDGDVEFWEDGSSKRHVKKEEGPS